ncbi:hypothetical protein MAR_027652 [Mya arenaria]|uniref:Uncharacterized protein n=1 Tax=Mya arenaria TaxID=6604 RepID=A0ABY7EW49_MYAAR|nr:hypothetical protein MAR_027652 [Mya arenaria]
MLWFPGGPPLTFLPFPMPDGDRRPGSCPDHECCGGHFLPPSEVIEKRLKVNIWLEHLNNVAANRERGQAKAAETRSLKKKELRTETTPGGAATSTATTHRSSARSPNHSQAQSAPDNIERSCLPTQAEMDGCKRSGTDEQATIDCWCSDGPGCNSRIIYTPNSLPNSLATRPSTGGLLLLAIGVAFKLHLTLVPVI